MNYEKEIKFVYEHLNKFIERIQRPELEGNINVLFVNLKNAVATASTYKRWNDKNHYYTSILKFDIDAWDNHFDEDQKIATIAHEFAHILQRVLFPSSTKQKPHGKEFKAAMMLLGYSVIGADCYSTKHVAARKKL